MDERGRAVDRRRRRRGRAAGRARASGSGTRRISGSERRRAGDPDREPARHLERRTPRRRSRTCRRRCVASSIIPIISAIPTGSFAPDSPSRIVPVRPRDLAAAEHREHDRRIGRRERGAEQAARRPGEAEQARARRPRSGRRSRTCRARRARGSARARPRKRRQPMSHAAVEEDHDQRDDADPLDGHDRDRVPERGKEVGGRRGGEQEERRARDPRRRSAEHAAEEREREARRDDEDDLARRSRSRPCAGKSTAAPELLPRLQFPYMDLMHGTRGVSILRA